MKNFIAVCNDGIADTWEVQAIGDDGQWWVVSDSSKMDQATAECLAELMASVPA